MTFDLCVPAYNEASIIKESLARIRAVLTSSAYAWNVVVVDNGSDDGTAEVALSYGDERISAIQINQRGKGVAIVEAARRSESDLFGFIDADLSADPRDITTLLDALSGDGIDIVIGSRLMDARVVTRGTLRSLSSRIFNLCRRVLLGIRVADSQCGLKVMNARGRNVMRRCGETGWFLDMEFLARAEKEGLLIKEVPVHWNEGEFAGRKSKLRLVRDGFGALSAMVRIRNRLATL